MGPFSGVPWNKLMMKFYSFWYSLICTGASIALSLSVLPNGSLVPGRHNPITNKLFDKTDNERLVQTPA